MRWVCCYIFSLLLLLTSTVYGQATTSHADEIAIRELIHRYVDARNNRDAEVTRSLFTTDADQLVSTGEWRRGINAVVQGTIASSQKEKAKSSIQVETVRFLEPDVALADGLYETVSAATRTSRKMRTTLVLKRRHSYWQIAAIRNMLPAPASSDTALPR